MQELQDLIKTVKSTASLDGHRLAKLEDFSGGVAHDAVKAGQAALGSVDSAATRTAEGALERVSAGSFLGEVGTFFLAAASVRDSLYWVSSKLPSWIGMPLRGVTEWLFVNVTNIENVSTAVTSRLIPSIVPGWATFIDWLLPHTTTIQHVVENIKPGSANLSPVEHQIGQLQAEFQTLHYEVDRLNARVFSYVPQAISNIPSLEGQVQTLEHTVTNLEGQVALVFPRLQALTNETGKLQAEINALASSLGRVESTVVTWPDLEQQLEKTVFTTQQIISDVEVTVQEHTAKLTQLAPLLLLLEAGWKGLKVLRSLEDKPCQCPKFNHLPNDLGTFLAVKSFIEGD